MKKLAILAAVVVLLGLPAWASANTVGPITTSTPISATLTDWTGTLAFPQFNSALGTLTQVDLNLSASMNTVITVTNTGSSSSNGTAKVELQLSVLDPLSLIPDAPQIDKLWPSPGYAYSGLAPGYSVTSGTLSAAAASSSSYTATNLLAEFIGSGNILLDASTYTQTWLSNHGGNSIETQVTDASLTGTITYEYTPAPVSVPPSAFLLGTGLLGLGLWRLRRID